MSVLLFDDFSGTLVVGSGIWSGKNPTSGPAEVVNSGGKLQLPYAGYLNNTQLSSYLAYPVRCTTWTWNVADIDTATIYSSFDFFRSTFVIDGNHAILRWQLRWDPPTLGPPETPGTDTAIMLFPSYSTFGVPSSGSGSGKAVEWNPVDHKYLRIREECLTITWQTSADGTTWVDVYTADLGAGFIYDANYAMEIGVAAGITGTPATLMQLDDVAIEKIDDCLCPGGGWHVGRVGSGGSW